MTLYQDRIHSNVRTKRSLDLNDTVSLYIPKKSKKTFQGYLTPEMKETYDLLERDFSSKELMTRVLCDDKFYAENTEVFCVGNGQLIKNPLAIEYYNRQRKLVDKMITEFASDEFAFIKEQLEWIDMEDTFGEKNSILFSSRKKQYLTLGINWRNL